MKVMAKSSRNAKDQHTEDSGLGCLLFFMFKMALPVWERYRGLVPSEELDRLDKDGDWPNGTAAAIVQRLNRDKKFRTKLQSYVAEGY
jgi:hypothetical protein